MKIKRKYYYFIMIIFLFEPTICIKYQIINNIFIIGLILSFMNIILISIKDKIALRKPIIYAIIWRTIATLTTIYYHGDYLKSGYQSVTIIALLLYAEWFFETKELDWLLKQLYIIFTVYLFINLITYFMCPNGLYNDGFGRLYFLGIRTRFTEYAFAGILVAITCRKIKNISIQQLMFTVILSLLTIISSEKATGLIGVFVVIVSYFILNKVKFRTKRIGMNHIIVCGSLIITILFVVFRIQNIFSFIIVDLLHKDLSLTTRTTIWDNAFLVIKNSNFVIGNGYLDDGNFIPYGKHLWQAHNQLIQLVYEVGIVGTYFFYRFISSCICEIKKESKYTQLVIAFLISILIMMITELCGYILPTYVIFIIAYYRGVFDNLYKNREVAKND